LVRRRKHEAEVYLSWHDWKDVVLTRWFINVDIFNIY
jgi:hypothetical protein